MRIEFPILTEYANLKQPFSLHSCKKSWASCRKYDANLSAYNHCQFHHRSHHLNICTSVWVLVAILHRWIAMLLISRDLSALDVYRHHPLKLRWFSNVIALFVGLICLGCRSICRDNQFKSVWIKCAVLSLLSSQSALMALHTSILRPSALFALSFKILGKHWSDTYNVVQNKMSIII